MSIRGLLFVAVFIVNADEGAAESKDLAKSNE